MADQLLLHELPWYYMAFFMCILDLNASAGWSIDTTWAALLLHGFFACVYWIWMTLLVDQELLHELPSYYMSFWSIYAVKGNCWLVYSLLHEFPSYYMTFWTHILDLNASDGWPTSTTWTPLILHGFFYVYTGFECPCWLIKSYYMNSLVTTWVFEAYAVKGICWLVSGLLHYFLSYYMAFLPVYTGIKCSCWYN